MSPPRLWRAPRIAADASSGDCFVANLRATLEQVEANALGRAPGHLHQLRVGIRRLRSTLRAFQPLLRRRKSRNFDRALRSILHALGAARDWDVFLHARPERRLLRAARRRSAAARRRERALLRSVLFAETLRLACSWAKTPPWRAGADPHEPAGTFSRRALRRLEDRLRRQAAGIDWSNAAQRHRVRIRAKRLRYGCECFLTAYGDGKTTKYLARLRKLQRVLGEMNDIVVQRGLLRVLARDARLRKTAAELRAALDARESGLVGDLARRWRSFAKAKPFWAPA